jgi:hypothetical protein
VSADDSLAKLWDYVDRHRGRESSASLVDRWLHEQIEARSGPNLTPDLLYALSLRPGMWQDGQFLTPQPLAAFIAKVAAHYSAASVLDPTCGSGVLLHAVARSVDAEVVHGIEINARAAQLGQAVLGNMAMVVQGDAFNPPAAILNSYDLIVADPPLGMRLAEGQKGLSLGPSFKGELGHALTVWACQRLRDHGAALVIVTPAFLWGRDAPTVHEGIAASNCRIRALIHLPGGSLQSTGIDSYLVVLERGQQKQVFIAQYSDEATHQEQLLGNLQRRKPGPHPALGRLCTLAQFKGFESFAARERVKRLARTAGWTGVPAAEVFPAHRLLDQHKANQLEHGPNSVYLRLIGQPSAALKADRWISSSRRRIREVLHLHVNGSYADPRFLVHWFNVSQIGQATLAAASRSSLPPRVDLTSLLEATLYLPSIGEQINAIDGAANLTRIRAVADELERALWDGTGDMAAIVDQIATINQEDSFEDWMESLPFPLSSILWLHHASGGSFRERYEILLNFFEATAAFMATVHLSAFMASDELWDEYGRQLSQTLANQGLSLDRPSFGAWKTVTEFLSNTCGKLIRDTSKAELWQRIYGTPNRTVLAMLAHVELRNVLPRANRIRNDWKGHAGAVGDGKAEQIHAELMELVHSLRGAFGRTWCSYELIKAGNAEYKGGVYLNKVKRLMGTRSAPFEEVLRESIQPLETDALYLFDSAGRRGLQLQPFVRVMPSPEKHANACFIFNRREADGFRFVSYHFEAESAIADTTPEVGNALARLHFFDGELDS